MKNGPYHSIVLVGCTTVPFVKAASCGFGVSLVSSPPLSLSLSFLFPSSSLICRSVPVFFHLTCLCHLFQLLSILFWPLIYSPFSCGLLYSFLHLCFPIALLALLFFFSLPPFPFFHLLASSIQLFNLFPYFIPLICSPTLFNSPCRSLPRCLIC